MSGRVIIDIPAEIAALQPTVENSRA